MKCCKVGDGMGKRRGLKRNNWSSTISQTVLSIKMILKSINVLEPLGLGKKVAGFVMCWALRGEPSVSENVCSGVRCAVHRITTLHQQMGSFYAWQICETILVFECIAEFYSAYASWNLLGLGNHQNLQQPWSN